MKAKTKRVNHAGFTVIELLVAILILVVIAAVAVANIRGLRADNRDEMRKRDINAIYYQLEAFHERNDYYPKTVGEKTLKGIDPESLKDTSGVIISEENSEYTYSPKECKDDKCQSFELSTELEREATFTKLSLTQLSIGCFRV